jgi:hypothetical protein
MHVRRLWLALTFVVLTPVASLAQEGPLAGLVARVIQDATLNRTATASPNVPGGIHEPHFLVGESLARAPREMNLSLGAQVLSFPLSSSSGGFSYATDPTTGEATPASTTFGPAFAERALTIGKGKFNIGFSFQSTSYDSFEGVDLEGGGLAFTREHSDCCPVLVDRTAPTNLTPDFEKDLLRTRLSLEIESRATAIFANYGVSDRFDVGLAIPFVNVDMTARVDAEVLRTGSRLLTPLIHSFDGAGAPTGTFVESGSSNGLGDILLRAKYNFARSTTGAFAAAVDLRLPTGDKDELLGTGATQLLPFFVYSGEYGIFSPHVNIGYTFSSGESSAAAVAIDVDPTTHQVDTLDPNNPNGLEVLRDLDFDLSVPNEFNYTFGFAVAAGPRVTVGFDLRGRTLLDVSRFEQRDITFTNRGPSSLPTENFVAENDFSVLDETGNLNLALGIVGAKINVAKTLLLNISVLFPLTDNGLKSKVTPVIGFDYVF